MVTNLPERDSLGAGPRASLLLLCVTWCLIGALKLIAPDVAAQARIAREWGVLNSSVGVAYIAASAIELASGAALLLPKFRLEALRFSVVLSAVFLSLALLRSTQEGSCGCLGRLVPIMGGVRIGLGAALFSGSLLAHRLITRAASD